MSFIIMLLYVCAPVFLLLALVAIILKYTLRFVLSLLHVPNYATAPPSGVFSWTRLAPPDILFRLAALAALNLVLYWLPIYYWSTYTRSGDDRDGGLLFYSDVFCPVSWILGVLCYAQVWRVNRTVAPRHRAPFCIACSLLFLLILSTLVPQLQFYVRLSRF